ncbi:MAG: DNA polymerase III subunit alpha [Bacteroidota bacterium]
MYLNCHSYYSLRYGTMSVEELVQNAVVNDVRYLALTDINCTTGAFDFIKACEEEGIHPIVGMEYRLGSDLLFIALAQNAEGFREINELITRFNLGESELPLKNPDFNHAYTIYPTSNIPDNLADHEYIGIRPTDLQKYDNPILKNKEKLVCLHPVTFQNYDQYQLHKLLRSIDYNIILSRLGDHEYASSDELMLPISKIREQYQLYPDVIRNTEKIIGNCQFTFDFKVPKNKKTFTGSAYEDKMLLESLATEGFRSRYSSNDEIAKKRLFEELEVIDKLQFACYFLTTWDIVRYSMNHGYFHVGRGSGANSIVAYCLRITEVDPIELNLYFSRFLNTNRSSPPDFDLDWSWKDRDDIIAYIFKRFGREHTGFCGTVTDFKYRSTIRELGKVYGLPKAELDILTRSTIDKHEPNEMVRKIHRYGSMLRGFPNQYSMHSCGIFVSDKPISYYSTMNVYQKGIPTCEIDMYIAESINLQKLDILSQRGLGTIKDAVALVKENQGIEIDITETDKFKQDEKCNEMLSKGKTLGCFYIESPAMRGLLRRLKCDNYETLVAASSIIRPGVAQSGMMREYLERHNDPTKIKYFHPVFEEQLKDTYGVMVYQEDVIKIAHHFAHMGFDEADMLRRGMSGKTRSKKELQRIEKQYFDNCKKLGYPEELTNEVYRQIASFAGYSFCKSHSASYAVESYQSLYLKAYYPLEFITAVLNNHGGFYRQEVYINEGRVIGATVVAPDINHSEKLAHIKGETIHLGLGQIINITNHAKINIPLERHENGPYSSLENLIYRTNIKKEDAEQLIYVGAMRSLETPKVELIIQCKRLFNHKDSGPVPQVSDLFNIRRKPLILPKIERNPLEDIFDELEGLGFPVSISPFDLLKTKYRGDVLVKDLPKYERQVVKMLGYLVSIKDVPIKQKSGKLKMNFGTWFDVEGAYFDTVHFPQSLIHSPFRGLGCYLLLGEVILDFDFPSVEIIKMARLPMVDDPRYNEEGERGPQALSNFRIAHSMTRRAPYPSKDERDQLYGRKPTEGESPNANKHLEGKMSLGGRK